MSNSCHHSTSNPLRYFLSCDHEQRVHLSAFENVVLLLTTTCSNHTSYIMKACAVLSLRHITKLYVDAEIHKREKRVFDSYLGTAFRCCISIYRITSKTWFYKLPAASFSPINWIFLIKRFENFQKKSSKIFKNVQKNPKCLKNGENFNC